VAIDIEDQETIFVGPNNSGKTSATAIFRCFLGGRDFKIHDFSVACIADFEKFAASGQVSDLPEISLDLWFTIDRIPSLLGVSLPCCRSFPISPALVFGSPTALTMLRSFVSTISLPIR